MKFYRIAILILILYMLSGQVAADDTPGRTEVVYRLKWLINASTAGDVFAQSQGFFAKEGLDVVDQPDWQLVLLGYRQNLTLHLPFGCS